ncbi:MAG: glycosyltransferase [Gemmatimonadota bacterium]
MDDVRWFAPNRYCALPVSAMQSLGMRIAVSGDAPASISFAADGQCAVEAYHHARRHRSTLVAYLWDLPPWRLANGKPDSVLEVGARLIRVPRLIGGYRERAGYYSRMRFVARRAELVLCPSAQTAADLASRFGVRARQLPFCYDSDRFNGGATVATPTNDVPILLSISRLEPSKNHGGLLRAAALLGRPVTVRIVGRGSEAANLRRLACELGITLQLDDAWASDDEIVAAYLEATVVVCPSRFEGFGLTPMEGLAMGRRVVASDIPTHREFVGGRVELFDAASPADLARALEASLAAPDPAIPAASPLPTLTIEAAAHRLYEAWLPRLA